MCVFYFIYIVCSFLTRVCSFFLDSSSPLHGGSPTRMQGGRPGQPINGFASPQPGTNQNLPRIATRKGVTSNKNKSYSENFSTSDYESGTFDLSDVT